MDFTVAVNQCLSAFALLIALMALAISSANERALSALGQREFVSMLHWDGHRLTQDIRRLDCEKTRNELLLSATECA